MSFFGILRIFRRNRKKEENWKIWAKSGSYAATYVGNPRCGVDLCQGVGYPLLGEVPKWHPSSLLCRDEGLHRNVAVLLRGVATVHSDNFF